MPSSAACTILLLVALLTGVHAPMQDIASNLLAICRMQDCVRQAS